MRVGIVGLGLIGGSFAKAYQEAGHEVLAFDCDESVLSFAQLEGAVSAPLTKENISTCDLVLVAIYPEAAVNYAICSVRMALHVVGCIKSQAFKQSQKKTRNRQVKCSKKSNDLRR